MRRILATRLRLVPLAVADATEMVDVLADPDLYRFTGGTPPTLADLERRYHAHVAGRSADGTETWRNWIVRRLDNGQAIGVVPATLTDAGHTADVAWVIGVPWQGHGWEIIASDWGVDVYDGDYGTQWFAWTACAAGALTKGSAANHTRSCFPQVLKYDLSHPTAYDTQPERRKIACHEFGHSYGLRHSTTDGTSTCMTAVATQSTVIGISSHDKSHLNGYFQ